jgi:hypothetical protein
MRPTLLATGFALACFHALGAHAEAQPGPPDTDRMATATTLFEAAQGLVAEGRAGEACPKFEESYRLVAANGTLINLADCYERVGKTASAWLTFRDVAQQSRRDGQDARADVAEERVATLAPRLTKLRIVPGQNAGITDLMVQRDNVPVGPAALGVAVPVDPGPHRISASAPGYQTWSTTVTAATAGSTHDVELAALAPAAPSAEPLAQVVSTRPWQQPMGITLLSVGAAGVITGVVLGGVAKTKADDADCSDDNVCSTIGLATRDDAVRLGNVGTGVGIAGAVLGALGVALWITAPSEASSTGLWVAPTGARFVARF